MKNKQTNKKRPVSITNRSFILNGVSDRINNKS